MKTPPSHPPLSHPQHPHTARASRLGLAAVALAALSACQKAPEAAPAAKTPPVLLGGLQPGDTVTVVNCTEPQPGVCTIAVVVTAPPGGSGDACTVAMASAVSLPRTTATLRWQLRPSDANYNYRFREGAAGQGFGVHLIDNLMYDPASEAASAPAPAASSPMRPIWVPQVGQPDLVEMARVVRIWPPRISAYDVFLDYQAKGSEGWTACKTWDPIVINHE